jgi:hypothetical protein
VDVDFGFGDISSDIDNTARVGHDFSLLMRTRPAAKPSRFMQLFKFNQLAAAGLASRRTQGARRDDLAAAEPPGSRPRRFSLAQSRLIA